MSECQDDKGSNPPLADRTGRIVHLADFNPMQPARILNDVHAYWNSLRRGRAVPARSDIQPQGIRRALDHAFILERIAPGTARFRLAGQHLIDLMGMEVRGMAFCSLANSSSRGRLSDVLESVFRAPQLAQMTLHAKADYARPELSARMLLLPLTSDLGDVTRALGCIIAEGQIGVAPRRFDLTHDEVMPILEGGKTVAPSPSGLDGGRRGLKPLPLTAGERPAKRADSPESRRASFRVVPLAPASLPTGASQS
ncbi:PAS domain-containing protein [Paracoccus benzoatiresistens]|uniref:PAS domain-containing protein n=1 Tax=Paracoccus benzoatiresistens TaxID=2997341 RepID=A0ABT4J524_9RHOB|nr:PAS domain-containing protein [Paracoccus sp. EF6]MCZ0962215.1 PAS domain-containing protein [Paracoccus sp. EF6]